MPRFLVLFGTTEGHTREMAEAVASTLRTRTGASVEVREPDGLAPSPEGYDGVLVAASVHGGRFQREVIRWVRAHAAALERQPTAFVAVCLGILQKDPAVQADVQAIVSRFFAQTGWQPSMTTTLAGALMYTRYPWWKRLLMKRIAAAAGGGTDTSRDYDYTDWAALAEFTERFGREAMRRRLPAPAAAGAPLPATAPEVRAQ